jgi:hypothetical protein
MMDQFNVMHAALTVIDSLSDRLGNALESNGAPDGTRDHVRREALTAFAFLLAQSSDERASPADKN